LHGRRCVYDGKVSSQMVHLMFHNRRFGSPRGATSRVECALLMALPD
jgi:hypothetical protein